MVVIAARLYSCSNWPFSIQMLRLIFSKFNFYSMRIPCNLDKNGSANRWHRQWKQTLWQKFVVKCLERYEDAKSEDCFYFSFWRYLAPLPSSLPTAFETSSIFVSGHCCCCCLDNMVSFSRKMRQSIYHHKSRLRITTLQHMQSTVALPPFSWVRWPRGAQCLASSYAVQHPSRRLLLVPSSDGKMNNEAMRRSIPPGVYH